MRIRRKERFGPAAPPATGAVADVADVDAVKLTVTIDPITGEPLFTPDAQREEGGTVLAIEALHKARATDECRRVQESSGKWAISPIGECAANDFDVDQFPTHWTCASALLDGFSVEEVTAAEEALA